MEQIICKRCCMDKSAEEIVFTETGCNFCDRAVISLQEIEKEKPKLGGIIEKIKKHKGKYNVLIGLSGGVDSSYTLIKAVELGLKPLCFSVDNGWNNQKADENILNLVERLKVPFIRYTINLSKFRELQGAFIRAGQKNLEIPTDHILLATTYEMANKYGIKWILSGGNVKTESIMPESWGANARDLIHIKDVFHKMTGKKLKGLPVCSLLKWNYYLHIKKVKTLYLLDYLDYNLEKAKEELKKYGWQEYHEKHCESIFTWWFQNYYLFTKFGIDKRKAHLSSLVVSGQMTRKEAMEKLSENPVYPQIGLEHLIKKYSHISHTNFKTDEKWYNLIRKIIKFIKKNE